MIYLDHNASSQVDPRVLTAMQGALSQHGNAASNHRAGRAARAAVEEARAQVARLLGASPSEVVFTSGGTEADFLALLGAARALSTQGPAKPRTLALSRQEHPAVVRAAGELSALGWRVEWVDDPSLLVRVEADLYAVMRAQNETGVLFDVESVSRHAKQRGALVHCDAVQAAGRVALDVQTLGADFLAISGHKFGGPLGAGALYVRRGAPFVPLWPGSEEGGRRAGSLNVPGIVGLGEAARLAREERLAAMVAIERRRDALVEKVRALIPGVRETGAGRPRLPNTAHLLFPVPCDGEEMLVRFDELGICVSTGAACASGSRKPSPVLLALGLSPEEAQGSLRVSLGPETTEDEIARFVEALPAVYRAACEAAR
jgi:cysteine desulfurase